MGRQYANQRTANPSNSERRCCRTKKRELYRALDWFMDWFRDSILNENRDEVGAALKSLAMI